MGTMGKRSAALLLGFGAAIALLLAGCGANASTGGTTIKADVKTASLKVSGKTETVLVDAKGMTLYFYVPDTGTKIACSGGCLKSWPPLLAKSDGKATVGDSALKGKFGTLDGPGGKQVTYNGIPLYHYAADKKAGEVKGEGVFGVWFVATPNMRPLENEKSAAVHVTRTSVDGKQQVVLTDGKGHTLYWFVGDSAKQTNCRDKCLQAWPMLAATGSNPTSDHPLPGAFAVITVSGGKQVTYNGHPLYVFSQDQRPGNANGQNVGAVWFVATPNLTAQ